MTQEIDKDCWAIVCPRKLILWYTIRMSASESRSVFVGNLNWKQSYNKGYRCKKIIIKTVN